jgi:hypothetical protein
VHEDKTLITPAMKQGITSSAKRGSIPPFCFFQRRTNPYLSVRSKHSRKNHNHILTSPSSQFLPIPIPSLTCIPLHPTAQSPPRPSQPRSPPPLPLNPTPLNPASRVIDRTLASHKDRRVIKKRSKRHLRLWTHRPRNTRCLPPNRTRSRQRSPIVRPKQPILALLSCRLQLR